MADIGERKLATIRVIDDLQPIEGADLIEKAVVGGWNVVVKRGELKVGDLCVYCEIDSFLGDGNPAWQFLVDKQPKMFNGKKGHKLRSIKLRGVISQGFVMPLSALPQVTDTTVGTDVTEVLCIEKWEAQLAASLVGQAEGLFPSWLCKSDQNRFQNILSEVFGYEDQVIPANDVHPEIVRKAEADRDQRYEVTIKLDGSSMTAFAVSVDDKNEDGTKADTTSIKTGVCSRNLELKVNEANAGNSFVKMFMDAKIDEILTSYKKMTGCDIALQGELMGNGIQGNQEMLNKNKWFIFDVYLPFERRYALPVERRLIMDQLYTLGLDPELVSHVPVLHERATLQELGITDTASMLKFAEGPSLNAKSREGVVFKAVDRQFSFKAISNAWLLKNGD